jgi:hypothetical protein
MKLSVIALVASVLPLVGACSVGSGVGAASGTLYAYGCSKDGDYCPNGPLDCATEQNPQPYDLKPSFFAGEPIDDLREFSPGSQIMRNRLIIRLQSSGKQIELNDVLTFDVVNSYEVARCVRGRVDGQTGKNDWDETQCYRASDDGPGRMRLQYDSSVRATLNLKVTCTTNLVADAVSESPVPASYVTSEKPVVTDGNWASWVEFLEFGAASQHGLTPIARDPIEGKFRIGLGDRVYATQFKLTLIDDGVVNAAISSLPRPPSMIGGTMGGDPSTGRFDFDLQRGQGAQFFP